MSNWKESEPADDRNQREIIQERIEMLAAVFSKKISAQMIVVFQDALERYPKSALKKGFTKAEIGLERFPTPKIMRELCNSEMPSRNWRYNFIPSKDSEGTLCLLDPDPDCNHCREPRSLHPVKGCPGFEGSIYMYRPQDCPEGREFSAKFREIAGK